MVINRFSNDKIKYLFHFLLLIYIKIFIYATESPSGPYFAAGLYGYLCSDYGKIAASNESCSKAAILLNNTYVGIQNKNYWPTGCVREYVSKEIYVNSYPNGLRNYYVQQICSSKGKL